MNASFEYFLPLLPGSEKVKLGSVIGGRDTLIESKNINKSLLVLGKVIK